MQRTLKQLGDDAAARGSFEEAQRLQALEMGRAKAVVDSLLARPDVQRGQDALRRGFRHAAMRWGEYDAAKARAEAEAKAKVEA